MKKKKGPAKLIRNRRATFDYALQESYLCGMVLSGAETKSLRMGHGQINNAYVVVQDGELWLINAHIPGVSGVNIEEADQTRKRKLLLKKREIAELINAKNQGLSIIAKEVLTASRFIKIRIAIGKGKKHQDKRETIKKRDQFRDIARHHS